MDFMRKLENSLGKEKLPDFKVGDSVDVHYKIREGEKTRTQRFSGTVIAIKGQGIRKNTIVRRIVQGEGVERTFPLHSPNVEQIKVTRRGDVRRSKLYYLRDRQGKQTKVKEMLVGLDEIASPTDNAPAGSKAEAPKSENTETENTPAEAASTK